MSFLLGIWSIILAIILSVIKIIFSIGVLITTGNLNNNVELFFKLFNTYDANRLEK